MSTGTQISLVVGFALLVLLVALATRRSPRPPGPVTGDLTARLHGHIAAGRPIVAIKELRQETGMGLREAKEYVDALTATGEPPRPAQGVGDETLARVHALVAAGRVVLAVKAVRDETGWDLRRSKEFVDRLPRGGQAR